MKRVGILTFQFAHNYGAQLQAYALKSTLENSDVEAEVINYLPSGLWENYSLNPKYALKNHQIKKVLMIPIRLRQALKFKSFQKNYLQLNRAINILDSESVSDKNAVIVGSDQVWSTSIIPDVSPYFFENIHGIKKLAYAASFGTSQLSEEICQILKRNIKEFSFVSVREESSVKLINDIVPEKKVYHVLDPVFLLDAGQWRNLYGVKRNSKVVDKYILYIDLRNDHGLTEIAKQLSQETGLNVYYVHPTCWKTEEKSFKQLYDVGPLEYLSLIDHAEYVVTNSFHAVAFSCIFSKKVLHYADKKLAHRVDDLFASLYVDKSEQIVDFSKYENNRERYIQTAKNIFVKMIHVIEGEKDEP